MPEQSESPHANPGPAEQSAQEAASRRAAFHQRAAELDIEVDPRLVWYHTIDLGRGLITPGTFDLRPHLGQYGFPDDLSGKRVLEIGPGSGFFTFELLRRNASLTCLEIPSFAALDRLPGRGLDTLIEAMRHFLSPHCEGLPEELDIPLIDWLFIEGPFQFCCRALDLRIERRRGTVYQVADPELGLGRFDLVFIGDVLLHVIDPVRALAAAAAVCDDTLIIAQPMPDDERTPAGARWRGGADPQLDYYEWWLPNPAWYVQFLRKLGFEKLEMAGQFDAPMLATEHPTPRTIIHAHR